MIHRWHETRRALPLTDWRSTAPHTANECRLDQCPGCGCCAHGVTVATGCRVDAGPAGTVCDGPGCGCANEATA